MHDLSAPAVTPLCSALSVIQDIPSALINYPSWINWKAIPKIKKPFKNGWQDTHFPFSEIITTGQVGIGFVYTDKHPFVCFDIDSQTDENIELLSLLQSYTEVSPSGKGYHVIVEVTDKHALLEASLFSTC